MCIEACDRGTRASQHNICTRGPEHSCTAAPAVPMRGTAWVPSPLQRNPLAAEFLQVPRQLQKARCSRSSCAAAIDLAEERKVVHGRRQLPQYRYSTPCDARPAPTASEPVSPALRRDHRGEGDMRVKSLFHLDLSTMEGLLPATISIERLK